VTHRLRSVGISTLCLVAMLAANVGVASAHAQYQGSTPAANGTEARLMKTSSTST
jgi:hypothetical protein